MPEQTGFDSAIGMRKPVCVDRVAASLCGRQHGVIARWQLLDVGMSRDAIQHRLNLGRLHLLYRGVYAVGHKPVNRESRWMAAVLACGPRAALSHRTAAANLGLRRRYDTLEVTVPADRARPGITVYTSSLPVDEVRSVNGIPTTCLPGTLLDLASVLSPYQLERALNEAEIQRRTDPLSLPDLIDRYPGRKGIGTIKRILDTDPHFTRSDLEALFIDFAREQGLPAPRTNFSVLGYECDCAWPEQGLIVELDARATHDTRIAFEQDRERDRALQAAGWRVVRVTGRQLHRHAAALTADLQRLLDSRLARTPR
jgi:very-short-patch-repair endonuclease